MSISRPLTIALPSGALLAGALRLLDRAGIATLAPEDLGRRLLIEVPGGPRLFLTRPTDVPTYVEFGAADLGVVGKDILWEGAWEVYELYDLGFGSCDLVLAAGADTDLAGGRFPPLLRAGTKYPRRAGRFFAELGQVAEMVPLHGSIELAPQVGLVDAIVDLTATGRTLSENGLVVVRTIETSTARLVGNRASLKTRADEVQETAARLRNAAEPA